MKINKQSNVYTLLYIVLVVVIVGVGLAFTYTTLKPLQQANAAADKMKQILSTVMPEVPDKDISEVFDRTVEKQLLVSEDGSVEEGDAFDVNVSAEVKKPASERKLPLYICKAEDGTLKYVVPLYGSGLWGPIWGYVAVDDNGSTIYGAYFAHQGETPGLGAEIEKPFFRNQFRGHDLFVDGKFLPISVMKAGTVPTDGSQYVDAISGGTITSKGVDTMMKNCLSPYGKFFETLKEKNDHGRENIQ